MIGASRRSAGQPSLLLWLLVAVLLPTGSTGAQEAGPAQGLPGQVRSGDESDGVERSGSLGRRASGLEVRVVNYAGPVEGATVRVSLDGRSHEGTTGSSGTLRLPVRAAGAWDIVVEGEGHLASEGVVPWPQVIELEVELRSLDETTPSFAEGTPHSEIRQWLEKGQTLLDAGDPAAARAELSKALPHLDRPGQAEVRVTLARAWWLEGERARSLEELEEAIRLDPGGETARSVFTALMEAAGRGDRVVERLEQLAQEPPDELERRSGAAPPEPDPVPAAAHRIGFQELVFEHRHDEADLELVVDRLDYPKELRAEQRPVELAEESFDVYVPESYGNRAEAESWGGFVWISPVARGGARSEEIRRILEERRLIWVGANDSGNPRSYWQRVALALHAAENARRLWEVDPERIFVGGYSGGGRVASSAAWLWPETFRGAVFWMGVNFWDTLQVPYAPGKLWPARFPEPNRAQRRLVKERSRLALITGDHDFNRSETRAVADRLEELGYDGVLYRQIPDADHYAGLLPDAFREALEHIDPRP